MAVTVQQGPSHLSLKVCNDLRYDWLRDGELPGCLGHAALLSHRLQDVQIAQNGCGDRSDLTISCPAPKFDS
jgi:hypothetical protein